MSVRLKSFQYLPRGTSGWGTGTLLFGNTLTVVQGANETGKTPIMKGVAQALGHEVELPPHILEHCMFAELEITVGGKPTTLTRKLGSDFHIQVREGDTSQVFTSEGEYGKWFAGLFSAEPRVLTNKHNQPSELYANLVLPALWVDQDHGWTTDYWTPPNRNFILDQRQEVIRFLIGLSPRHPFRSRTAFDSAKQSLERTERSIEMQRFIIDRLQRNEQLSENEELVLVERRDRLQRELELNSGVIDAIRSSSDFFGQGIKALEAERDELVRLQSEFGKRKGQLSLVFSELDGEEDILTANVQATELLRHFCGRQDCQMFSMSERSFGRSLLFLKDQIKDLKASDRELNQELESVNQRLISLDLALQTKREEREHAVASSPQAELMYKLGVLTKELVEVELRLAKVQQYAAEQKKFERLLDRVRSTEHRFFGADVLFDGAVRPIVARAGGSASRRRAARGRVRFVSWSACS